MPYSLPTSAKDLPDLYSSYISAYLSYFSDKLPPAFRFNPANNLVNLSLEYVNISAIIENLVVYLELVRMLFRFMLERLLAINVVQHLCAGFTSTSRRYHANNLKAVRPRPFILVRLSQVVDNYAFSR